ncbi:MAG TPA: SRPBCC family protein [Chthoniobacterales bacterium]
MATNGKPNELKLTRVYDAPVRAVWDAWTDPEQAAHWWGPRGFTITTHSKDLRPGGHWSYTMHGPDGTNYENRTLYHEVEECAKLVYDHGGADDRPPLFRVTVLFSEAEGRTTMEMTMKVETPEALEEIKKIIKHAGGNSTWDRLAEYLAKEDSGKEKFVINRTFEAPKDVVFAMWTAPSHIAQWLPPQGFTMEFLNADIRPGGSSFYRMSNGRMTMYGRAEYLDIQPPEWLVYKQQFADEHGAVSRHPMAPTWPETMLTTIAFSAEGSGATRVTVTMEPYGPATAEEIAVFANARGGMTMGWTGSLDKLEELLAVRSM